MALSGWSYGREFTFAAVATAAGGVQVDLLLSADNFSGGFTAAQSDGADLRVTDDADNLLPFHLQFFDQTNSLALVTVLTPLSDSASTSVWVYAGNASASSVSSTDATYHKASRGDGVIAAWDFDEASGATVEDKIGTADFTLVDSPTRVSAATMRIGRGISGEDPVFTSGNGAVTFNGTSQYATVPGVLDDPGANGGIAFDFTIVESPSGANGKRVMSKFSKTSAVDGTNDFFTLYLTASTLIFEKRLNNVTATVQSTLPISQLGTGSTGLIQNRTYHICLTWGSRGMEIWIDGYLNINNATTTSWNAGSRQPFTLAGYNFTGSPSNLLNCTIGGLVVYDHQPTQRDIIAAMRRRSLVAESATQLDKLTTAEMFGPAKTAHDSAVYEPKLVDPGNGPDGNWHCFFTGGSSAGSGFAIWYAYSADRVTWTHPYDNPIIGQGYGTLPGNAGRGNVFWDADNSRWVAFVSDNQAGVGHGLYLLTSTANPPAENTWTNHGIVIASGAAPEISFPTNSRIFREDSGNLLLTFDHSYTNQPPQWVASQAAGGAEYTDPYTVIDGSFEAMQSTQVGSGIYSTTAIKKIGSVYYGWMHGGPVGSTPNECYALVAGNPRGPWYKRYGAFPYIRLDDAVAVGIDRDQVADPSDLHEYNGETYQSFDVDDNTGTLEAKCMIATYAGTNAEFVADAPVAVAGDEFLAGLVTRAWKATSKATVAKALAKQTTWKGR